MQKYIRAAGGVGNETVTSIGVPHFQFPGAHPVFIFSAQVSTQEADGRPGSFVVLVARRIDSLGSGGIFRRGAGGSE